MMFVMDIFFCVQKLPHILVSFSTENRVGCVILRFVDDSFICSWVWATLADYFGQGTCHWQYSTVQCVVKDL